MTDADSPARFALWALAAYLCLTLFPLGRAVAHGAPPLVAGVHVLGVGAFWQAARMLRRGSKWRPLLVWLPLAVIPMVYAELPLLMLGAGSGYHDAQVQWIERTMFGGSSPAATLAPTIDRALGTAPSLVLSELLHVGYLSFYPIIYAPLVLLALRRETRLFGIAVAGLTLVFLVGFLAFILFPVQGPRYLWPTPPAVPDGMVRALTVRVLEAGSSRGTAFPSLHVAIAVTQSSFALQWHRSLGLVLSTLTALLAAGAVYGGYHYVVDIIAGAALGLVAGAILRRSGRTPETIPVS